MSARGVICSRFGPYQETLKLGSIPSPEPEEGFLKVQVQSCGLAFPDVLTVEGKHMFKPVLPFVPGNEVSGIVTAVGQGVHGFKVGDRVFGTASGGLCEETVLDAQAAYHLPRGVSWDVAAGFELNYGTTWHGLVDLGRLKRGETLLVLGAAGGVGMAAIDIAQALGCKVVACASTAAKLAACKEAGAEVLVNYAQPGGPKAFKKALKEAGVYGSVDMVYDPVGGSLSEVAMRSLGWGGRFIVIGFASGGATPKNAIPRFPLNLALLNEREIIGCFWGAWKARDGNKGNRKNVEKMIALVEEGRMKPLISRSFPLSRWQDAFDHMMARKVIGKITIQLRPAPKL